MKALITGSEGFVGRYLRRELEDSGYQVVGVDLTPGKDAIQADLTDSDQVLRTVEREAPDVVFHLAALANVGLSWRKPQLTFQLNVISAVNLMESLRVLGSKAALVIVGSSDQYGPLGAAGASVREDQPMRPVSPYAVSKIAQENMGRLYAESYGLDVRMTRSFNHGGAGQKPGFMIPDFASGIVRIERKQQLELSVGNLAAKRDFTHVKDMVRAYRLIAEKGKPGTVYNVGSGKVWSAREVLDRLIGMAECPIPVRQDPARMRPSDTPVVCCDHSRLTEDTGWMPVYSLDDILRDTLAYYRGLPE